MDGIIFSSIECIVQFQHNPIIDYIGGLYEQILRQSRLASSCSGIVILNLRIVFFSLILACSMRFPVSQTYFNTSHWHEAIFARLRLRISIEQLNFLKRAATHIARVAKELDLVAG